jgi:hypothetical protein
MPGYVYDISFLHTVLSIYLSFFVVCLDDLGIHFLLYIPLSLLMHYMPATLVTYVTCYMFILASV